MSIVSTEPLERGLLHMDAAESVRYLRGPGGLTEADLAEATRASARTVRRWSSDVTEPQARYKRSIDDLREIVRVLEDSLTPRGIRQWLWSRNGFLRGDRPISRLRSGDFDAAYAAAVAFRDGDYV